MSDHLQSYASDEITITFDPKVCTHSGNCVRGLSAVFDVSRRPWVSLAGAPAEVVAAQVKRCPSGALQVKK
jgi:uncharacterized Fe-S cluster protein YjdI